MPKYHRVSMGILAFPWISIDLKLIDAARDIGRGERDEGECKGNVNGQEKAEAKVEANPSGYPQISYAILGRPLKRFFEQP